MEGNQQKMREALEDIVGIAKMALNVNCVGNSNNSELWSIIDKCRSALSAPTRNCDLKECSTDDGMISAHERFCKSWHEDGNYCSECPFNTKSKQMTTCREMWLLATATERKGEVDGDK